MSTQGPSQFVQVEAHARGTVIVNLAHIVLIAPNDLPATGAWILHMINGEKLNLDQDQADRVFQSAGLGGN